MVEKEVRYLIDEETRNKILLECAEVTEPNRVVDITIGKAGFDSLEKFGYIIRLREKKGRKTLECKKRLDNNEWMEYITEVDDFKDLLNMFAVMGFVPYLLLDRVRVNAKYNNLLLAFDNVVGLGSYIEIEYQESDINSVYDFINRFGIANNPQGLYGDIFKDKIENDSSFKEEFEGNLKRFTGK